MQMGMRNSALQCRILHKYALFHIFLHLHSNPHPHYITNFKYKNGKFTHADADAHFILGEFARADANAEFRKVS